MVEVKVLNNSKEDIELEISDLTIAEILKVYLNKDSDVVFAAWKRDHPTKNPVLKIQTKGKTAKKAVNDAVNALTKELDKVEADFSKLK